MSGSGEPGRSPLWLKLLVTGWLVVWAPIYWAAYGPQNFLWFCDLANFLIAAALWLESPVLLSSQAVSVLAVQIIWTSDVGTRLLLGFHPIGGTEFMFDPAKAAVAAPVIALSHRYPGAPHLGSARDGLRPARPVAADRHRRRRPADLLALRPGAEFQLDLGSVQRCPDNAAAAALSGPSPPGLSSDHLPALPLGVHPLGLTTQIGGRSPLVGRTSIPARVAMPSRREGTDPLPWLGLA